MSIASSSLLAAGTGHPSGARDLRLGLRIWAGLGLAAGISWVGPVERLSGEEPPPPEKVVVLGTDTFAGSKDLITLKFDSKPLKQVLEYLSNVSNLNIKALNDKTERLLVSCDLKGVTYRAVLDFIAKKHGLLVDDSKVRDGIISVSIPPKISMVFDRADIRQVINSIAAQANVNIVIGPEVAGEVSMRLDDVPWLDALNVVVKTLDFVVVKEKDLLDTIRVTTPAKLLTQLQTRIFHMSYLTPDAAKYVATLTTDFARKEESEAAGRAGNTLIDVLLSMLSTTPGAKLAYIKRGSALIVTDTAEKLDAMQSVIAKLDLPPKQIFVSAKIVAITDTDVERLGVNWGAGLQFNVTPTSSWPTAFPFDVSRGLSRSALGTLSVAEGKRPVTDNISHATVAMSDIFSLRRAIGMAGGLAGAGFGVSGLTSIVLGSMGFGGTNAAFEMIRTKTNSKVIQSPQLMTLDNEEATIQVGQLFRYAESFVASTEGGGQVSGFREASGSPIKLGLQLLIIPHVTGPENNILLTAIPKTEDLLRIDEFVGPSGIVLRLPQTSQRIVVTRMLLRNNETGVIGGLRTDQTNRNQNHVPVFSEIPIIGRLFKHRTLDTTGENLMIFMTPSIVDLAQPAEFKTQLEQIQADVSQPFAPYSEDTPRK